MYFDHFVEFLINPYLMLERKLGNNFYIVEHFNIEPLLYLQIAILFLYIYIN